MVMVPPPPIRWLCVDVTRLTLQEHLPQGVISRAQLVEPSQVCSALFYDVLKKVQENPNQTTY